MMRIIARIWRRQPRGHEGLAAFMMALVLGLLARLAHEADHDLPAYALAAVAVGLLLWLLRWHVAGLMRDR